MHILTRYRTLKCCVLLAASLGLLSTGFAKMEEWTDTQGNSFKAEPAEVVGPFALFRLPNRAGKLVLLNMLSAQDCVRFATAVSTLPEPAADWAQSKTVVGKELYGSVQRVVAGKLAAAELKGTPEPRFYVLYFGNTNEGGSWRTLGQSAGRLPKLQKKYPGLVEGVMLGVGKDAADYARLAVEKQLPYLVAAYEDLRGLGTLTRLVPIFKYGVVVCTTGGVPLFAPLKADRDEEAKKVMTDLEGILELLKATNPQAWGARSHYWKAVQPALHPTDKCEPMMIGDPLSVDGMVKLGVKRFEATLSVSAEGVVTAVAMSAGAEMPESLVQPISEALQKAPFVAAVASGKFVAGQYLYRFGTN